MNERRDKIQRYAHHSPDVCACYALGLVVKVLILIVEVRLHFAFRNIIIIDIFDIRRS